MDIDLLALAGNKNNWLRFKPHIKEHVLSKEALLVFHTFEPFFRAYPAVVDVEWAGFESFFFIYRNAQVRPISAPNYKTIFTKLQSYVPSVAVDLVLRHYVTQDYAAQVAAAALEVRTGTGAMDTIGELVAQCDKELGRSIDVKDLFVSGGVDDVLALAREPGLSWRLNELNISLGPVRKGDFVMVAAYVETGKTTFAASEVSHMAGQITDKRPIIWVNNEERSVKVKLRIMQAALGKTQAVIGVDPLAFATAYAAVVGGADRIMVLNNDSEMNNAQRLTSLFRDLNPALIVFDQLDKVGGFYNAEDGEHMRLGKLYKWARDLAHEYGPVIALSQTDASSESQQYIHMNQLRGSKVDKPGEADAIITIGKSNDPAMQNVRYLHVAKNKLAGGPLSVETERHGKWEVTLNAPIARYEGTR